MRRQIILQGHGAYPELTKGYLEGIIGTVSAIVNSVEMDDDESRKLWIIADESAQMGKVPIRPRWFMMRLPPRKHAAAMFSLLTRPVACIPKPI